MNFHTPWCTNPVFKVPHGYYQLQATVATLAVDRIAAPHTFKGAMNTERFCFWVGLRLIPTLRTPNILYVNNLPDHKSKRVCDLCRKSGIALLFLPRYSQIWNPIKKYSSKLKSAPRRPQPGTFEEVRRIVCRVTHSVWEVESDNCFKATGHNV